MYEISLDFVDDQWLNSMPLTSKTFRESRTVSQIFTVDQVSLLLPIVSLFSTYHNVFLGIHYYQPLKHCTIIIIKCSNGFDLSELLNLQRRIPNLKHSIMFENFLVCFKMHKWVSESQVKRIQYLLLLTFEALSLHCWRFICLFTFRSYICTRLSSIGSDK